MNKKYWLLLGLLGLLLYSCVEQFEAETREFESILVVDARLTDERKRHQVRLNRTFRFGATDPVPETNATVRIVDDQGLTHEFAEAETGIYYSNSEFAAQTGRTYTLQIVTASGDNYASEATPLPDKVPITDMRAVRVTNDLGEEGVGIYLDTTSATPEPSFFRYEYEETYKIIAPRWDPFDFEVVYYEPCTDRLYEVAIVVRQEERRVCFSSNRSTQIIQASTEDLVNNEIQNMEIRFISRENYIMSHRYSINVKQFSQTVDAHSFYERLDDFASSESLFSQVQPGLLEGNITSDREAEAVLGYFEVAAVSEQRLYFNYADLFPDEPLPPYPISCETPGNPRLYSRGYHCAGFGICDGDCESPLIEAILAGVIAYADTNEENGNRPYFTWARACGDCTDLGSNVVPEFWTEE
ncbi:MAG: DUF4249 domain-containing protein [Bacteroidota bacterium]